MAKDTANADATETVAETPTGPEAVAPNLGTCANCNRPAVIVTNFSFASPVAYCGFDLPEQYRYLLGG